MADDWQKGDLALCVDNNRGYAANGHRTVSPDLIKGKVYSVDGVAIFAETLAISLVGVKPGTFGTFRMASRFIKITPPESDEFDREIIELMNRKPEFVK